MFEINEDNSIYVTRGDILFFSVTAKDGEGIYHFSAGDVVRIVVYGKKACEDVVLQKDFPVLANAEEFEIYLGKDEMKFGEIINKPKDYWYEVVVNPDTAPQTIIGYGNDGPALFKLFPEGEEIENYAPTEEDIPFVDEDLDLTSSNPVANRVIAAKIAKIERDIEKDYVTPKMFGAVGNGKADDTAAMQEAINEAIKSNKALRIPVGQYRVTDTLTLTDTINMSGEGQSTQNTHISTILFDVGDNDIPLLKEAEGVTQVGRCTFSNVSFMRVRTAADGKDTNDYAYGKTGICIGFNSNETSFHRCTFVGFGVVCQKTSITDFVDCDIVYCDSILSNTTLCNSLNFYGGNIYACGTLLRAYGNISTLNFTNSWIEDFVTLLETRGVSILGMNFIGCTMTNTANGEELIKYTATPTFAREFINFSECLLYFKTTLCASLPSSIEFGMNLNNCTVYYGGEGETIKIYGNSKFLTLSGANSTVLATNAGFDTRTCVASGPIQLSNASLSNYGQIGKPNIYVETKDRNGNRMIMLPVYYDFVQNPQHVRYFIWNTQAVSVGDWVLKFVYEADSGTIEKIVVSL